MSKIHIAVLAVLMGIVAASAQAQSGPYGGPSSQPGPYDPPNQYGPPGQYDQRGQYDQPGQYDDSDGPQADGRWGDDRDAGVDVGLFYDELSPYGEWVRHPSYGWVWFPRSVRPGWRPYSLGYWVESDYGWTWISDEPFGWATYHYGRWAWDPRLGWLWVPGTVWGPAWVAWQQGSGYIGWAPLPPAVGFEIGVGIRLGGLDLSVALSPRDYAFVDERRFLDRHVDGYLVPTARNVTIIHVTRDITNYSLDGGRVINHGVPVERIEQATGRRPARLRVVTTPSARDAGVQRDAIVIYRPPAERLQSVRVSRRNNAGLPPAPPLSAQPQAPDGTGHARPQGEGNAPLAIPVAPRTKPLPREADERQFQREQQDLAASQEREQRALEQIHQQEMRQAQRSNANAQEVARRQAAELQAQQEQRQRDAQQLQTRQQLERQAAQATAGRPHHGQKPAAEPDKPKKGKNGKDKQGDDDKPPPGTSER